ncbi:hypothetical protein SH449x_004086 [Pirellulaceae bacterium SH449]
MLHRTNDPETSIAAAEDILPRLNQRCRQFLTALRVLKQATAKEAAMHACPGNYAQCETVRRRASDLQRMGLIVIVGQRACKISGKTSSVYEEVKHG